MIEHQLLTTAQAADLKGARRGPRKNTDVRVRALELRLQGLTYAKIAANLGLSRQRTQQLLRPTRDVINALWDRSQGKCESCSLDITAKGAAHVHHQEYTCIAPEYNEVANLQLVCISCHRRLHTGHPIRVPSSLPRLSDNAPLLTTAEAAARLNIAPATVRQAVLRGSLAVAQRHGTGRHSVLLFDPAEVERYDRERLGKKR